MAINVFRVKFNFFSSFFVFKRDALYKWHLMIDALKVTHYANMSMQYTVLFHGCKNDNFQMKNCNIFHIFAQNIDCGYTLEPPQ